MIKSIIVAVAFIGVAHADGLRIAVEAIDLRSRPDGSSMSKGVVRLNTEATVRGEVEVAPSWKGLDACVMSTEMLPRWVKIEAGGEEGYVPEGALAQGAAIELAVSDARTLSGQARKVTKGFSEVEDDVALSTMKGVAGKSGLGGVASLEKLKAACVVGTPDLVDLRRFLTEGELAEVAFPVVTVENERLRVSKMANKNGIGPDMIAKFKKLKDLTKDNDDRDIKMAMDAMQAMINQSFEHIDPVREHGIGEYVAARFVMSHKVIDSSDRRSSYVRKIGQALVTAANGPACYAPCRFILVDAPSMTNACAISGGYIFVMSGLLDFVRDEDELACILAHELAHIELHHGIRAVGAGAIFQLFSSATDYALAAEKANDKDFSKALDLVYSVMTSVAEDGYGEKLEAEADWRGIQIAARLGYDVSAMIDTFKRLKEVTGGTGGSGYPKNRIGDAASYREGFGFDRVRTLGRETRRHRFERNVL